MGWLGLKSGNRDPRKSCKGWELLLATVGRFGLVYELIESFGGSGSKLIIASEES